MSSLAVHHRTFIEIRKFSQINVYQFLITSTSTALCALTYVSISLLMLPKQPV